MSSRKAQRQISRGGIQKRATAPGRVDRDGDLLMDATRHSRPSNSHRSRPARGSSSKPDLFDHRPGRRSALPGRDAAGLQKVILRGSASTSTSRARPRKPREVHDALEEIRVVGLEQSTAVSNKDGGIGDLLAFLERKATPPDRPARDSVRIQRSRREIDAVVISVRTQDVPKLKGIDGVTFAGTALAIEVAPANHSSKDSTIDTLRHVLSQRYDPATKFLDLSKLGVDPGLVGLGVFDARTTESKFFPALMKICDGIFKSAEDKEQAVQSVSMANNALSDLSTVTALAQTFPALKNLDLSHNDLKDLRAIEPWRWKFRKLEQLMLMGNGVTNVPDYRESITKWYPVLSMLDAVEARSSEAIRAASGVKLPLPVQAPLFRDEASIGENFVKHFFPAYDLDRSTLVDFFYDDTSTFSLNVNSNALPNQTSPTWGAYLKYSRNLLRLDHLSARMSRVYRGQDAIKPIMTSLPRTKHPDLMAEHEKWCIECHTLPGVPDAMEHSTAGVGGLIVTVHGMFQDIEEQQLRSFDRTFVLGPGGSSRPLRVISDSLTLRAYGGHEAWIVQTNAPEGDALLQKQGLVLELSKATSMTPQYSTMCLEQSGWNLAAAATAFEQARVRDPDSQICC